MENTRSWQLPAAKHGISSALCIISDVEHCSHQPGNPVARLQALLAGQSQPAVLESLFPEVRSLAYLSAGGRSPQRADWLAARGMPALAPSAKTGPALGRQTGIGAAPVTPV